MLVVCQAGNRNFIRVIDTARERRTVAPTRDDLLVAEVSLKKAWYDGSSAFLFFENNVR